MNANTTAQLTARTPMHTPASIPTRTAAGTLAPLRPYAFKESMSMTLMLVLLLAWPMAFPAFAATHTWTGNTSGLWSTAANWENNDAPALGESPLHLVFPTNATRRFATNNFGGLVVNSITFHGAAYTLAGLGAGTNLTIDGSLGNSWWNIRAYSGTGHTLHPSLNLILDGNLEFNIATNAGVIVRSRLSAATANSGLTKDGSGAVTLDPLQDNTFDGTTTINDGMLSLQGSHLDFGFTVADVTVPGPLVIGNSSPLQQPVCSVNFVGQIADTAPVTIHRNGQLLLDENNETIGSLTMHGGTVDAFNSTLTLNGNVDVHPSGSAAPSLIQGRLHLGTFGRFFTVESNAWLDVSAVISGGTFGNAAAGVTKNGPGWMSLSSPSNTFGGYLQVNAGTLSLTHGKQLGPTTNGTGVASNAVLALTGAGNGPVVFGETLSLAGGAVLRALADSEWHGPVILYGPAILEVPVVGVPLTIGGQMSGPGGFTKTGPGSLTFVSDTDATFSGPAQVADGELLLSNNSFLIPRLAITSPFVIGDGNPAHSAIVKFIAHEQIATNVPVRFHVNGQLLLQNRQQTFASLQFDGGELDSGPSGLSRLLGNITATNQGGYEYPVIRGQLDLGNAPRTIHVEDEQLYLQANVLGGPAASLIKTGSDNLYHEGSNTYAGLTLIQQGTVIVTDSHALGSTDAGTEVASGACLYLSAASTPGRKLVFPDEHLQLAGQGTYYSRALGAVGTNIWTGDIHLAADATIHVSFSTNELVLGGIISGPGGLTKYGAGRLLMEGAWLWGNSYQGPTVVDAGELILHKTAFPFTSVAIPGDLVIGKASGAPVAVRVAAHSQLGGLGNIVVHPTGTLDFTGPYQGQVGSLSGIGVVTFAPGARLSAGANNADSQYSGALQGGAVNDTNLVKLGSGRLTFAGANTLLGRTEVQAGLLLVNSQQPTARFCVSGQGALGGVGRVSEVMMGAGTLAPGADLGTLRIAALMPIQGHQLAVQIHGQALGTGFDQLAVDAAPDLSYTQLAAILGNSYHPALGQSFLILSNRSASPITAPFLGLNEGSVLELDATHRVQITYLGGDGNDVVLTVVAGAAQLSGVTINGNRAYIHGTGTPGASYSVEATATVANPASWVGLGTVIAGPDGLLQYIDADMQNHPHRFFRFVAP